MSFPNSILLLMHKGERVMEPDAGLCDCLENGGLLGGESRTPDVTGALSNMVSSIAVVSCVSE